MKLKLALAQMNPTLGDFAGNAAKVLEAARKAAAGGADVLLTPALALSGAPAEDRLFCNDFLSASERALARLMAELPEIDVLVGHPLRESGRRFNAATLCQRSSFSDHTN